MAAQYTAIQDVCKRPRTLGVPFPGMTCVPVTVAQNGMTNPAERFAT